MISLTFLSARRLYAVLLTLRAGRSPGRSRSMERDGGSAVLVLCIHSERILSRLDLLVEVQLVLRFVPAGYQQRMLVDLQGC